MRRAVCYLLEKLMQEYKQHDGCLLVQLLVSLRTLDISARYEGQVCIELYRAIDSLLTKGYTLRSRFPSVPMDLQCEWLGRRLVLGHSRLFAKNVHWTSIVSSRLGRYGRLLDDWPALLELLLRSIRRTGSLYLAVPDTSVAPLVEPLLARSAVPHVRVDLPSANELDAVGWLIARLGALNAEPRSDEPVLHVSPELPGAPSSLERWPLQDRIAISCASRVRALVVRPKGTIAHLLSLRLADSRFGMGTVSVWMPSAGESATERPNGPLNEQAGQLRWLERGAVGWYVPPREPQPAALGCRQRRHADTALWQWTSKYALCCSGRSSVELDQPEEELPRYLVHCVRGTRGALPPDAAAKLLAQMWLAGHLPDDSPLATLASILESGVLRGRSVLNRAGQSCVSFSAVPLDELLSRRAFQPHLGRWDWEPYGLMIERQALERLGTRPVIYGDAELYGQLNPELRPFFQPARRRHTTSKRRDWIEEREWRCLGDVRLNALPRRAVHVFVAYEHQAQAFARHSPWPVIWLQAAQTLALPTGSKHPRRKEVRTGKS